MNTLKYILITIIGCLIYGCCTPNTVQIETSRTDTVYHYREVHDTFRLQFVPEITITDTTTKIWSYPTIETKDTTIGDGNKKFRLIYRRDSKGSKITISAGLDKKDSIPTIKTVQTKIYEKEIERQRPWWEWLVFGASLALVLFIGGLFGKMLR